MKNPSDSLMAKLRNTAKSMGIPMENVLRRYAYDRLLSLISKSNERENFCLKGGILLSAIFNGDMARPTEDLDFNGMELGLSINDFEHVLTEICNAHDGLDGLAFETEKIKVLRDREGIVPGGKIMMPATIGKTRIRMLIDIGYGNAITPTTHTMEIPTILPSLIPPPRISVYPAETTIAEKMHAMARHGIINTRIKDYYDIWRLSEHFSFDGEDLVSAVRNTFIQHGDEIPKEFDAMSTDFSRLPTNKKQWNEFTKLSKAGEDLTFEDAVEKVRNFLLPVIEACHGGPAVGYWDPETCWQAHHARFAI